MYITKTLATPKLDKTDCLRIDDITYCGESLLLDVLADLQKTGEWDVSDDELVASIFIKKGYFTHRDWQAKIIAATDRISAIDHNVDPKKKRLDFEEQVYFMGGCTGRITPEGYKMISALTARACIFAKLNAAAELTNGNLKEYVEGLWSELDAMLSSGAIIGEYTDELLKLKY